MNADETDLRWSDPRESAESAFIRVQFFVYVNGFVANSWLKLRESRAMPTRRTLHTIFAAVALAGAGVATAQWYGGDPDGDERRGVPNWENDARFKDDVFTFVRIEYDSGYGGRRGGYGRGRGGMEGGGLFRDVMGQYGGGYGGRYGGGGWGRGGRWATDFPDSDLNFSFRLQQLTTIKVNPQPIHMRLTDEKLYDYPFIYMIEPGALQFSEDEVKALRRYLLRGGFLMVDDFWGDFEWENFYREIKRVFPDREPEEVPLDHEIFHCVYRLKEKPQVPSIHQAMAGRAQGITYEFHGGDSETVHYRAIYDDKGRMMAFICHNTDLGDGWEREGEEEWYFHEFSEKKAYPMGINIVVYAMSH